jgi:signal transduction histidine kinase
MLHDFIVANRQQIIARVRRHAAARMAVAAVEGDSQRGVPLFLTQLVEALSPAVGRAGAFTVDDGSPRSRGAAARMGGDLLKNGHAIAEIVHGYGDILQAVTALARETHLPVSVDDFQTLNLCLDDAVVAAVTEYGLQRERLLAYENTERQGILAHELRNLLNTAMLSFDVIKNGSVGFSGSTGAMLTRSLVGLRTLVEQSLSDVRLDAGVPRRERISVCELINELEVSAILTAKEQGLLLTVTSVDADVAIDGDPQLLASAIWNLLQNAFKFSRPFGSVSLTARATADRVLIEVRDECGGLAAEKAKALFLPFTQGSSDHSGLGLGLTIALRAVQAHAGNIKVHNLPGLGCAFTVDLPRQPPLLGSGLRVLPGGASASPNESDQGPNLSSRGRQAFGCLRSIDPAAVACSPVPAGIVQHSAVTPHARG